MSLEIGRLHVVHDWRIPDVRSVGQAGVEIVRREWWRRWRGRGVEDLGSVGGTQRLDDGIHEESAPEGGWC